MLTFSITSPEALPLNSCPVLKLKESFESFVHIDVQMNTAFLQLNNQNILLH